MHVVCGESTASSECKNKARSRATVGCPEVDSDVKMCLWRVIIERKWMRKLLIK